MTIERIHPAELIQIPGLAQVVVAQGSRMVFLSGQTPQTADGALVGEDDLAAQARQTFINLKTALDAAGATIADVVRTTIYVVGYEPHMLETLFPPLYEVFGEDVPASASTLLGVQALYMAGQLIEVDAIAVLD